MLDYINKNNANGTDLSPIIVLFNLSKPKSLPEKTTKKLQLIPVPATHRPIINHLFIHPFRLKQ